MTSPSPFGSMTLRCLVVDDEPLARERLGDCIGRLPHLTLAASCASVPEAVAALATGAVDLLFLDVGLEGISGVQWLATGAVPCPVILVSASAEHALTAFDLQVADYLLKPFSFERFVQAVSRAQGLLPRQAPPAAARGVLFVRTEFRLERVLHTELLCIEGRGDYRCVHTPTRRLLTPETFGELESRLPADRFCRVHKSWLVALDKVERVVRDRLTVRDLQIPVSATYRTAFYARIGGGSG